MLLVLIVASPALPSIGPRLPEIENSCVLVTCSIWPARGVGRRATADCAPGWAGATAMTHKSAGAVFMRLVKSVVDRPLSLKDGAGRVKLTRRRTDDRRD